MKITNTILLLFICMTLFGQVRVEKTEANVSVTQAVLLGTSVEVRDIVASGSDFKAKKKIFKKNRKAPDNFKAQLGQSKVVIPELEHLGADPIRQSQHTQNIPIEPLINVNGIGDFGSPHDPTGEIGLDHYVQAVNVTQVGVFDKEGNLIQEFAMADLWAPLGVASAGDPIVLFDESENRWFITEFTDPANLLIAVSVTSDPLGSFYAYSFSTPNFPDYPKYGIWPDALAVSTNEFSPGGLSQYVIDKAGLIAGDSVVTMQRILIPGATTESGFLVSIPVDADGDIPPNDARPLVVKLDDASWGSATQDEIDIIRFDINWNDADSTSVETISIATSNFDSFPCISGGNLYNCIPQSGGEAVSGISEIIMNVPKFRNLGTHESIVLSFITDVTDGDNLSGIRWVELRKAPATEWSLYQEGTYSPDDSLHRFMPSIAMDRFGNIALGYSVSSPDDYIGIRYTGRFAGDPPGEMTVEEYNAVTGVATINSGGRYGDYSHMSVDPVDGSTFWYTSEYAGNGSSVTQTRIIAFELGRDTFDLRVASIVEPTNGALLDSSEIVTIKVQNRGFEPMANYDVGFFFDGVLTDQISIPDTLFSDSTHVHSFANTVDMSVLGAYEIKAFISHPLDSTYRNDTLLSVVNHLLAIDGALTVEQPMNTCTPYTEVLATVSNNGADNLVSGDFHITLNGTPSDTVSWTGNLSYTKSASISIPISDLVSGVNNIDIVFTNINGDTDQDTVNNTAQTTVDYAGSLEQFTLNILTDDYPTETTWEVADSAGNVIFSGGPYNSIATLESTDICLDTLQCYTFTIFDSYQDGICCDWGQGNYNMVDEDGNTIFSSTGQFLGQESQNFCVQIAECLLTASFIISDDSGNDDGSISVGAANGTPPYMYSINGGTTFQPSFLFTNLMTGDYEVVIRDATGACTYSETVFVPLYVSTTGVEENLNAFVLKPNPNDGYFTLEFSMKNAPPSLDFEIIDVKGSVIQSRMMSSYDGVFIAPVSLVAYPSGTYFVRVFGEELSVSKRVIKR